MTDRWVGADQPPVDDLGIPVELPAPPRRIVSLVPSLTEAVAVSAPGLLAGATDYCTHPADLDVPRVGGSKYPSIEAILALRPDLVLGNAEENRPGDVAALREAGVPVWVTYPRTVDQALASLRRMLEVVCPGTGPDAGDTGWLDRAERVWAEPPRLPARRVVVPVWRRPWVVLGRRTFAADVLARLGLTVLDGGDQARYPRPELDRIRAWRPDLVVLPDEPYAFGPDDGPEAFAGFPVALVSGRHLTWYGPSLVEARARLERDLARAAGPAG